MITQPRQAPTAQPMFCSIETWRNALRRAAAEPGASGLPPPRLRPSFATPSRSRRPAACRARAASIGRRAAGERLVGPGLVVGTSVGHVPAVADRAVVGRDDVLDLVRQERRRVDLAGATPPRTGASPGGRRGSPRRPAPGRRPSRARPRSGAGGATADRPRTACPAGPSMSTASPGRRRVNQSVPRPIVRKWIVMTPVAGSTVLSENGRRRTSPDRSPVRAWTNWPARDPAASSGARYDWSHWPGRISRLSTSSVRTRRMVTGWRRPPRVSRRRPRRPRRRRHQRRRPRRRHRTRHHPNPRRRRPPG